MKSNELRSLYVVQKKLRSSARSVYLRVMNELFQHYESYSFVKELSTYFRDKRYDLALGLADSLSELKYSDATTHFVANQFSMLIRKYPWNSKEVKTSPEDKAIRSFLKAERKCFLLNKKFALYASLRSPFERQLHMMRSFIAHVLGDNVPLDSVLDNAGFGAGASIGVHGSATHLSAKLLAGKWSVTPSAEVYGYWALMRNPHTRALLYEHKGPYYCADSDVAKATYRRKILTTRNNKISFVPKTAKTHRAIAVEPLLNGLIQKGADEVMRKRLLRVGIDLSDQSKNQKLAREGSFDSDDSYVTIDLSSASDSISIGLVRNVLPPDWFYFLNSIRSPGYELAGRSYTYHKFCSMGNGFCFPLETLLFAACCHAVGCGKPGTDYSVYGDDIIVRKRYAGDVLRLLRALGFSPNANKTFITGPFRESCGSDWFGGVDVRPYTLDYELDSLENLFKWLNLTRRNEMTSNFFAGTHHIILDAIPHRLRFFRPHKGEADSGIDAFGDEHLSSSSCYFDRRKQVWMCKTLRHSGIPDFGACAPSSRHYSVDMYALLSGASSGPRSAASMVRYQVVYTFRRKTRTTIVFTGYSGATSTWLPPSRV